MQRSRSRILDEYLVAAARTGDRKAFSDLATRWQPKLMSHAWRLTGEAEMARDVVQDSWTDIVRSLDRLSDAAAFPAWAYRIVTRRAADAVRRVQKTRRNNAAWAAEPRDAASLPEEIENRTDAQVINRAMAQLPRDQRAALSLFYTEDLSVAEIAAALEVPAGTVKTRLMHARRKLHAALDGDRKEISDERS
jgi:RNA polymerase sigma-70 factor (ECF subfamily)